MRAADQHLDQIIGKLETNEQLRFKPAPASWQGKAKLVYRSRRLTMRMRRRMVALRLHQLPSQAANDNGGLNLNRGFTPRKDALAAIPELEHVWRARTHERLQQALDSVQCALLRALESDDPRQRLIAARLLLKTKQARERGGRSAEDQLAGGRTVPPVLGLCLWISVRPNNPVPTNMNVEGSGTGTGRGS